MFSSMLIFGVCVLGTALVVDVGVEVDVTVVDSKAVEILDMLERSGRLGAGVATLLEGV